MWLCVVLFVFSAHITLFFISYYCVAGATHKTQLLAENVSIRSGKRAHMMLAFICDCWWGHFSCCCALWGHNCGLSGEDAGRTSICMFYLPVRHTFHINGLYSNERSPFVVLCSSSYIIHANVEKCIFLPVFFCINHQYQWWDWWINHFITLNHTTIKSVQRHLSYYTMKSYIYQFIKCQCT